MAPNLCVTERRKQFDFLLGVELLEGLMAASTWSCSPQAEEGEGKHLMPFPPIVWLTIGDVFFTGSHMPCALETLPQGPAEIQS